MRFRARFLCLAALVALLLLSGSGRGQQTRASDQQLHDVLYEQEQHLASAEKRKDKSYFEHALDDELIYVAYNGLVFTKAKIVESLNYIDVARYSIQNMKVRALGADAGLVTYDLQLNGSIAGHDLPAKQYASSVWLKRHGDWVLVFHQSTPAHHK